MYSEVSTASPRKISLRRIIAALFVGILGVLSAIGILTLVASTESNGFKFSYEASALDAKDRGNFSQNNIIFYNDEECDPTATTTASVSATAKPSGDQITWIGDSYSVRAYNYNNQIEATFGAGVDYGGNSNVDTPSGYIQVGKTFGGKDASNPTGIEVATRIKDSIRPYLVFALSTNNIGSTESDITGYINNLLSLAGDSKIILVTAKDNRNSNYTGVNSAIKAAQSSHSGQIFVADWAAAASEGDFDADNLHLTKEGSQKWIDTIYAALPGGTGPATIAGGVTTTTYKGHTIAFPIAGVSKTTKNQVSTLPCGHEIGCHYGPGNPPGNAAAAWDLCMGDNCKNQTVVSITDGEISNIKYERTSHGSSGITEPCNTVNIKSAIDGTVISYLHMASERLPGIEIGKTVKAGQVIGHVYYGSGASGSGPCNDDSVAHVHIDKGTDSSATRGALEPNRDPEITKMVDAAWQALPDSGTSGGTNTESTTPAPALSPSANMPNNNAAVVWSTIANAGISGVSDNPAVIAGIVGNLMEESGGGTFDIDPFVCQGFTESGEGRGIFQASYGRRAPFLEYMGSKWKSGCTMKASGASQDEINEALQMETIYMIKEEAARNPEFDSFPTFVNNLDIVTNKTPEGYSDLFLVIFEGANEGDSKIEDPGVGAYKVGGRPASSSLWSSAGKRRENAKKAYEAFSGGTYTYTSTSPTGADPCPDGSGSGTDSTTTCSGELPEGGMTLEQAESFMETYRSAASKGETGTVTLEGVSITDSGCTGAKGNGVGGALNNCSAFSAWFVKRYTTAKEFPVTQGSGTVTSLVSNYGFVNLGNKPEVYSIVSMGPTTGSANGWPNHTGVVLGIDEAHDKIIIGEASCSMGYVENANGWKWPGAHEYSLSKYSSGGLYAPVYASTKGQLTATTGDCGGGGDVDISNLSTEEKVAQLFIVYASQFDSFKSSAGSAPGGVIFMNEGGDISGDRTAMKQKIGNMQSQAKEKMFIAVDEEGGSVARLASAGLCSNTGKASTITSVNAAKSAGSTIGDCMSGLGFNVDFAPVADTLYEAGSSVLSGRVFANSDNPDTVAKLADAFAGGLQSKNIIATYKHFPGHGSSAADSHTGGASTSKSWSDLKKEDIIPFKSGIDNGAKMIMAAHITTADSGGPASMSSKYLTDYLRGELGYKGLIVTDALNMGAATQHSSNPSLSAFKAGADLLLMPNNPASAYKSIVDAVKSGDISESRLNESVQRILNAKKGI